MQRIVIGIDPGTSCGWAVLRDGKRIASGEWDLSNKRHEGGGMRFVRLAAYLEQLFSRFSSETVVAYEEVARHRGTAAAHVYGGIVATLQRVCEDHGLPYQGVPVGTIKKHASGSGNCGKEIMVQRAVDRWGTFVKTDNEADALWCASALEVDLYQQ